MSFESGLSGLDCTAARCPECNVATDGDFGLDVKDITTPEDVELVQARFALRCQSCGFAVAFIAALTRPPEK